MTTEFAILQKSQPQKVSPYFFTGALKTSRLPNKESYSHPDSVSLKFLKEVHFQRKIRNFIHNPIHIQAFFSDTV